MSIQFLADDIWHQITLTAKGRRRGTAFVAVPYFGEAGSRLLPLRAGDTLLVNASEPAVKSGQTHPLALRRLLDKGVKLYTLGRLHAKIYVFGATAFIGSANASVSVEGRTEGGGRSGEGFVYRQSSRSAHSGPLHDSASEARPRSLAGLYRPPRRPRGSKGTANSVRLAKPRVFLAQIVEAEVDTEYEKELKTGEREAKAEREESRSTIDTIWRRDLPYRTGDTVIQVFETANRKLWVYPPAKVINRKVVPRANRKMTFVYLEIPDRPRRRLATVEKRFPRKDRARLRKQGPMSEDEFRGRLMQVVG
ncbi:MAG: hypothetical protein FJ284_15615 [Planctomycetes bacterium]|nr:hypothetical protein [Planctomycetota bacterium]